MKMPWYLKIVKWNNNVGDVEVRIHPLYILWIAIKIKLGLIK